ncbi:MAG: hypothetical protein Q8916_12335 [Bacteroidota bacterium]|nr:hypothetical protein [Bacteroidota bacterium]
MTLTFEAAPITTTEPKRPEIYAREQELSVRQASHYLGKTPFRETGYNTTTFGKIGFTRVETEEHVTEDILLQARLDILCDKLRARY